MAEERMSRLRNRGSIALAAVVVALLSTRTAGAQVVVPGHHGGSLNTVGTWAWVERIDQAKAEQRLYRAHEQLRCDAARNDSAAVNCDIRRIDDLRHRIVVDEWLIRKISCGQAGYYPFPRRLDPMTYCAIAQYHTPPRPLGPP
jgi:hypothetical protein